MLEDRVSQRQPKKLERVWETVGKGKELTPSVPGGGLEGVRCLWPEQSAPAALMLLLLGEELGLS